MSWNNQGGPRRSRSDEYENEDFIDIPPDVDADMQDGKSRRDRPKSKKSRSKQRRSKRESRWDDADEDADDDWE
ncbi:MAG: hypothetical protein GYB68_02480 [Chloroflexi bacterium]|nr:hypothetical protein [Chloroflexota bacterium]